MQCKNCHTTLTSESDFCHACGAKVIRKRLTLKNLAQHIGETFFNYDNKLFQTIIDLFKAPEAVIDSYVSGIRKRYINPISFFGISLTLTGFNIFIIRKFYKKYLDASNLFQSSEMYSNEASKQIMESSADFSLEYSSLIYASMIPIFALISWVVFINKRYNYTEHLVTYMYSMSLYSIVSVFLGLAILLIHPNSYMPFSAFFYVVAMLYHCFLLKRLFRLSNHELLFKTLLFLVLFFIAYVVFSVIIGVLMAVSMYFSGDLQEFIEAKKASGGG
ncbi:DUF3667 domain-containing protein [Hyunsoonleella sp. SJ7]|uniref:DUF3667 domain-containing protein n=1 Tax=Hyunsoonleella aquatilis TaxID=2762758 RepID=A0A923KL91_9FLAO|nr:DUF3667 domain-containing protein [Hyunsoonleella aquatilis]MBC3759262.1 DUF3667 domain-containing protein [Hyunsoonleella aquatilis]